jgi:hypothetical protein
MSNGELAKVTEPGARIIQTDHPEYGEWSVVRENPSGTWEVRKCYPNKGMIAVCATELQRHWKPA